MLAFITINYGAFAQFALKHVLGIVLGKTAKRGFFCRELVVHIDVFDVFRPQRRPNTPVIASVFANIASGLHDVAALHCGNVVVNRQRDCRGVAVGIDDFGGVVFAFA